MRPRGRSPADATSATLIMAVTLAAALFGGCGQATSSATAGEADATTASQWVVEAIGQAEAVWDASLQPAEQEIERLQDTAARVDPLGAYLANWSIGRYNIRPRVARVALDRAFANDAAAAYGYQRRPGNEALVRDIMDPERDSALVRAILARLRHQHPVLRTMRWDEIEASDRLIAKLYSGYLGAGHDWNGWKADTTPGREASERLGCSDGGARCSVVQAHRPGGMHVP